ncbi:vanadium-dependent haloperoxidase [Pelagicoccus mobilis]|uniref:Vanadium-dependent haloperoxidase n=1 Tax=Pelagicoccus mobilis TaxID=415221 RepID=A0A934VQZ8_9BACT|nr:vanadium-dependent haloperoxidase [Pelagicoccus mobilis]MBK1877024.1 vanadium-dependent haloperoxidase [Pelagicoccus mobilis]
MKFSAFSNTLSKSVFALLIVVSNPLKAETETQSLFAWTPVLANAIQTSTISPCLASRNLAIIYTSAFESANARQPRYQSYLSDIPKLEGEIDSSYASLSAIAFAAKTLFPSQRAHFQELQVQQEVTIGAKLVPETRIRSKKFGEEIAKQMISIREDDGSTTPQTYFPKNEIGKWKRTPPNFRPPELSYWSGTRPFVIDSASQFRLPPPPSLDSKEYAKAYNEVKEIGAIDSKTRTADQTEIAKFWSCFSYTSTPAGHWFEIATKVAGKEQLDFLDTTRLLALINLSMADAGIACWDTKYTYESWRPIQAIRLADKDENPETKPDPKWDSLLEAPPHPEYTSGHGAFSGAGGRIMELLFEKESPYPFSTTSSGLPGVVRSFSSFSECTDEICDSRLFGGIHFQYSNLLGRDLGTQIADYVFERTLLPLEDN